MAKRRLPAKKEKPATSNSRQDSSKGNIRSPEAQIRKTQIDRSQRSQKESLPVSQSQSFRIESNANRSSIIMGSVVLFGASSIYFYVDILLKLRNFYTLLFVVPLYVYVFGDLIKWVWSGIRAVEVDASGVKIVRSSRQPVQFVGINEIGSIRVTSSLDGPAVDILLHGASTKTFLWMYSFTGPRIHIRQGPFTKKDFAEFIQHVSVLAPVARQA